MDHTYTDRPGLQWGEAGQKVLIVLHKLNERENAPKNVKKKKADHLSFFTRLRKSLSTLPTHTHRHTDKLEFKLSDYYYHLLLVRLGLGLSRVTATATVTQSVTSLAPHLNES